NQRLVLDRVRSINTTTSDLIAGTAQALRTQGVEIQTQASSTVLDMEKLEQAFNDVIGAIDEVSRYRREALPRLDEQINRLEDLAARGNAAIENLEQGSQVRVHNSLQGTQQASCRFESSAWAAHEPVVKGYGLVPYATRPGVFARRTTPPGT